jgi:hypothetical protein
MTFIVESWSFGFRPFLRFPELALSDHTAVITPRVFTVYVVPLVPTALSVAIPTFTHEVDKAPRQITPKSGPPAKRLSPFVRKVEHAAMLVQKQK